MSISDRERLEFVFKIVDDLKVDCKKVTLDNLVENCSQYINKQKDASTMKWEKDILDAMHKCLLDSRNKSIFKERLNAITDSHPEKNALIVDLARRALSGELREDVVIVEIKDFSIQMERLYNGDLTVDGVWHQTWEQLNHRLHVVNSEQS